MATAWQIPDLAKIGEDIGKNIQSGTEALGEQISSQHTKNVEAIGALSESIDNNCKQIGEKLASDIEVNRNALLGATDIKNADDSSTSQETPAGAGVPQGDVKPYSNPIFDIPGEILDRAIFGPYYKARQDTTDQNAAALIDSGLLNIPSLKMLNIPKCLLFAVGTFSGTIAVYSLFHNKSSRIFLVTALVSHESLRISYNMYLTNTLALLAKKLIAEPEITQEAVQGVIKAKAQQALSDSLASIGISDSILGEKVGAGKVITDFASKLLPKVILDQTFISWLIIAFGGGSKSKPHTS